MPDVNIQIATPPLQGGQSFKVKYRLLPNGAWSATSVQTNAPFTLVGLAVGQYELSIILDKGDIDCPETIRTFTVVEPFECVEFDAEIVYQSNGNSVINVTYPTITTQPPCGWKIIVQGQQNSKTISYPVLGTSPLNIPIINESVSFKIVADLCNGKTETCYEADLTAAPEPCTPLVVETVYATWLNDPNNPNRYRVDFFLTSQSTPPTLFAQVNVLQTNPIPVGSGPAGQVSYASSNPFVLAPTQQFFSVFIDMNPAIGNATFYTFDWFIVDRCNVKHTGSFIATKFP